MPFVQNLLRLKTDFLNTPVGASPDMTFDGSVKDDNLDDSSNVKKCHASSMDRLDIDFGISEGVDFIAISFVKSTEVSKHLKSYIVARSSDGKTGEAFVSYVDKVIFVGSTAVGKMVMENASKTLTPVTLELGGKDAFIVCDDVDVAHVAQIATRAAYNQMV